MRVRVVVRLVAEHEAVLLEVADHQRVGVEDLLAGPRRHIGGVAAVLVHRHDRWNAGGVGDELVLLAEPGGDVHHACPFLGGHVVGSEDLEGLLGAVALGVGEEVEQRPVAAPDQLPARDHVRKPGASPSSVA